MIRLIDYLRGLVRLADAENNIEICRPIVGDPHRTQNVYRLN